MLLNYLIHNFWFSALLISLIYISDYFFTLRLSDLYQKNTKRFFEFEGGIELNPYYRKDINKLKKLNPRFVIALIGLNALLYWGWYTSVRASGITGPFEFILGSFILTELFIHSRHFRNLTQAKAVLVDGSIEGHIKYSRTYIHKLAATDAVVFSAMLFIFWLLTGEQFFLGGFVTCLALALIQKFWLKKYLHSIKR